MTDLSQANMTPPVVDAGAAVWDATVGGQLGNRGDTPAADGSLFGQVRNIASGLGALGGWFLASVGGSLASVADETPGVAPLMSLVRAVIARQDVQGNVALATDTDLATLQGDVTAGFLAGAKEASLATLATSAEVTALDGVIDAGFLAGAKEASLATLATSAEITALDGVVDAGFLAGAKEASLAALATGADLATLQGDVTAGFLAGAKEASLAALATGAALTAKPTVSTGVTTCYPTASPIGVATLQGAANTMGAWTQIAPAGPASDFRLSGLLVVSDAGQDAEYEIGYGTAPAGTAVACVPFHAGGAGVWQVYQFEGGPIVPAGAGIVGRSRSVAGANSPLGSVTAQVV